MTHGRPSSWIGGKFICHLVGHSHGDRIFYVGSQALYNGSTPTKQITIMVDAACCTSSAKHYGSIRVAKGRAQDSFNYVCFDKNAQRITIVKIGVDANVYGQHVDWTSVYYEETKPNNLCKSETQLMLVKNGLSQIMTMTGILTKQILIKGIYGSIKI
jgi:hypothetical protein